MLYCNDKYIAKIDNYQIREKLYFIATGQTPKKEWLLPLVTNNENVTTEVKGQSIEARDKTECPSKNNTSEMTVEPEMNSNYDEMKEKFKESMEKISLIFHQNFEKSPFEVTTTVEKMVSTLEKIKTPAAFSSAVATFGLGKYLNFLNNYLN